MKKINNYIRYLLILILLKGTKVFAQTSESSNQISSQTHQGSSNLLSSTTSSFINSNFFSEIIKQNIDKLEYYFINYAMPFLFVFGILYYLTEEAGKKMNRPLLLIYIIIALFVTKILHDILLIPTLIFIPILIIVVFHKIFRGIIGSIIGFLTAIAILYGVLTNNSLEEFLSPTGYFIFLFVLFITIIYTIFILGIRVYRGISQYTKEIKKNLDDLRNIIISSKKPQEIQEKGKEIQEKVKQITDLYEKLAKDKNSGIISMIDLLNDLLNDLKNSRKLDKQKIQKLIELSKAIKKSYEIFISQYNGDKEKLNNLYHLIDHEFNEPLRSQLLKILIEAEYKINNIKQEVESAYTHKYLQNEDLKRILNRWFKENIEDIIRKLKEYIKNAQTDLENFENNIKTLDISDIKNNKLKDEVGKIGNKMEEHKEKFDKEYRKAKIKLNKLYNPKSQTYSQLKSMVDALQGEFNRIYGHYNELANGLKRFNDFVSSIKDDIEDLENISRYIGENKNVPENCMKFNNIYNRIMDDINRFSNQYSRDSLIYTLLRKLKRRIESYQTEISDKCRQVQNFSYQMSFHYRWP